MLNEYQQNRKNAAQVLADKFQSLGFQAEVKAGNNSDDFITVINNKYQAMNWHEGNIWISEYPYNYPKTVSTDKQHQLKQEIFTSNKMKVLTVNKINTKLSEIDAYTAKIEALESENIQKHVEFLAMLSIYKDIKYTYRYEMRETSEGYQNVKTDEITGGDVIRNGILYEFELHKDGYINQKIKLHYGVDNDLKSFLALSYNKYTV